jgi:hypothetical protein
MFVLQKKLIFTQNPNAAICASYFEVAGGSDRHTQNDEKIILQYRVVAAVGWMCIVAYHAVYLSQLA